MLATFESQLANPGCLAAVRSADANQEPSPSTLSLLCIRGPPMQFCYLAFLSVIICGYYSDTKATREKAAGYCSQELVAAQEGFPAVITSTDSIASSPAFRSPFSGPSAQDCPSTPSRTYQDDGQCTLEMSDLQTPSQACNGILPKLWRTLVKDRRSRPCATATEAIPICLDMEQLGRSNHPKSTTNFEAAVDIKEVPEQCQGKRKGQEGKDQEVTGAEHDSKSFHSIPLDAGSTTLAYIGSCGLLDDTADTDACTTTQYRVDRGAETRLSRRTSVRSPRSHREKHGKCLQTADQRSPLCNDLVGTSQEGSERSTVCRKCSQTGMVETPQGGNQAVGGTARPLPQEAIAISRSEATCRSRGGGRTKIDPVTELSNCPQRDCHNTCGRIRGGQDWCCRSSRRRRVEEIPTNHSDCVCTSRRSRDDNGGDHCQHGRRDGIEQAQSRGNPQKNQARTRCWWKGWLLMIVGREFTCPHGIVNRTRPIQEVQDAEAYVDYASCAASIRWHNTASSCGIECELTTLFSQHWMAQRQAIGLRGEVALSSYATPALTPLVTLAVDNKCNRNRSRGQGLSVHFRDVVDLHVFGEQEPQTSAAIPFGLDTLGLWDAKPWKIEKFPIEDYHFDCVMDGTYLQPHVSDRWCANGWGTPFDSQVFDSIPDDVLDPTQTTQAQKATVGTAEPEGQRSGVQLRSEELSLPLAYNFASAQEATDQDRVITAFRGDSITIISFGHKLQYLEQRTIQLGLEEFHKWRERLRTLWADFDDGTFFVIHNIIPPPFLGRSTVSTIIQLAPIPMHTSLVLLQFVASNSPPEDPFVETVPAISMRRNVFHACRQHLDLEPTAIVKQGFKVWHTGIPQHVQSGAFLRILIDDPSDDIVSLTQSFAGTAQAGAPFVDTMRLLGEHRLSRIEPSQEQQGQDPAAPRLPPQGPAGTTRLYPWHMWEHFFNNPQEQGEHGVSLTIYGLALETIETTLAELRELSRTQLFRTVRSMYPEYSTWNLRIHMVCPQPVDPIRRTHVLAEFLPQGHDGLGNLCPVVTEVRWFQHTGLRHEMRAALYRPTPTACNLLLDDLEPRCLPRGDQHCSMWSRGLPCIVDQTITLHRGDFVQIRLMPAWSTDIPTGNLFGAEDLYRYGLTVTHWSSTGDIPLHFLTVDGQQHDSALSSFNTLSIDAIYRRAESIWGPQATATFVRDRSDITGGWYFVVSDIQTEGVPLLVDRRVRDANGRTFRQLSALIWHSEQTLRQLIRDNFDVSWSSDSDHRFLFVNQSPVPQDQLDQEFHPTPGTLVTVYHTAEEVTPLAFPVSYEEDRDDPIEDDEQFLLQKAANRHGQLQVEGNSVSGTLPSSIEVCVQCKPNGDILPDFDSHIRYQFQLRNGERAPGTILAPPNWDRQPALLYAADYGTVRRDASQQLLVYVRSWFLPHDRYGPRFSKDCAMPAQLLFRLLDRLRHVWRQELLPNDILQLRVVSPTPAAQPNEHPRLHVLLECNRPRTSPRRAILLTFQDLQPDGPSPVITWLPFLAPPVLTLQIIADVAIQPCDSRHLIVLAGSPDRRWMTEQDEREVQHGLYISVLRDVRRRFPTQRLDIEETSMMQSLETRGSSRSPRRSEGVTPPSTRSSSSTILAHVFRMSREHRLITLECTSDRSYAEQLTSIWSAPVHQSVIELHAVNSPPNDLELSGDSTYLVEFTADRQRQADPSDRLVLVDVTFTSADSRSTAANLRRTLWTRCFMSREDVLHLLASSSLCRLTTISCTVHLNHRLWPSDDTAHRQVMHGDYLHLVITGPPGVPTSHVQLAACERESADSQRYIYRPSPSPSPDRHTPVIEHGESEEEEDDGDTTDSFLQQTAGIQQAQAAPRRRGESDENSARSASVSLLQQYVSYKSAPERSPLLEVTNIALDRYVPGHLPESASKIGPHSVATAKKPHVNDRWCATETVQPIGSSFLRKEILHDPAVGPLDAAEPATTEGAVGPMVCVDLPPSTGSRQTLNLSSALFPEDTVIVRVTAPPGESLVPTLLEIVGEINLEAVKEELRRWGHSTTNLLLLNSTHGGFPIAVADFEPTCQCFFVLLWEDATDTCHWHETSTLPSTWNELDFMGLLGRLGKPKSVVTATLQLSARISVIQFEDVAQAQKQIEQVRWYVADLPRLECTGPFVTFLEQLHRNVREPSDGLCTLRPECTLDVVAQLFDTHDFLQTSLEGLELPPQCREFLGESTSDYSNFDRLRIYVDGSSNPAYLHWEPELVLREGKPDAWAFLVMGETYLPNGTSQYSFVGYATQPVCYERHLPQFAGAERIGSDVAEREALLWSGLWRIALNHCIPTVFLSDSKTAGCFAFGENGAIEPDLGHRLTRGVFQTLSVLLPGDALQLQHVRGHTGEVGNECCDLLAKWSSHHTHWLKRQEVDLRIWKHVLPSLWWYFFPIAQGLPPFDSSGTFYPFAPDLPSKESPHDRQHEKTVYGSVQISLCMITANVQTLGRGQEGFVGKLDYLQQQFVDVGACVVGIQEARTDELFSQSNQTYLRLASGADHGHHGVELWLALTIPFGHYKGRPRYFCKKDVTVLHRDPRRLLVRVCNDFIDLLFFVLHGPQSGRDQEERKEWWEFTTRVAQRFEHLGPLLVLGDMNATTGTADHVTVFKDDLVSANTDFLRDFTTGHSLAFPATTMCHCGPSTTWVSPDGSLERGIDHILIPTSLSSYCTHSEVLGGVDLGTGDIDHFAACLQLDWSVRRRIRCHSVPKHTIDRQRIHGNVQLANRLKQGIVAPWHRDIETHVNDCNKAVLDALDSTAAGNTPVVPKKCFITSEAWELRGRKNQSKHKIGKIDTALRQDLLWLVFVGWKWVSESCPCDDLTLTSGFRILLYSCRLKFGTQTAVFAKQLKNSLRSGKQSYMTDVVEGIPASACASQILTLMKPCIGTSNSRKRSRPCLPYVLNDNGDPCQSAEEARDRWINFFAAMEGGSKVATTEQRALWIENLQNFRATEFNYGIHELPTLFDLECALRRVRNGKATGEDDIPSEACGAHPVAMAKLLYPQLLKLALHGQEALIHKGGRLAVAHKKGPTYECSSYRSLLVSSHVGKSIHRALRQHQQSLYTTYLQSQQVGGRPRIPVNFGVHMVRSHLRACVGQGKSASLVFLDLTEAFYRVLRPLALGGTWDDQTLAAMAARLHLDNGAIHDLRCRLAEPDALDRAGVPEFHRKYLQALHVDTHFHLVDQDIGERVRTTFGSRPGDSFADVVFGYLWARVLHQLEASMNELGLLTHLPCPEHCGVFAELTDEKVPFLGPTWCDDLCICLSHDSPRGIETKTATTLSLILDLCHEHGMSPNLKKGKTEVLFSLRGAGSRDLKRKYYGQKACGVLHVVGERTTYSIGVVGEYRHLGGLVHATGDMRKEIRRRLAIAHSTFSKFRRILFHNNAFTQAKRVTIFQTLVMSQFTYGIETWTFDDIKTRTSLHAGVMRLYRRFLKVPHDAHVTDEEILVHIGLPSPSTLLRRARLRYLGQLQRSGPEDIWPIVMQDAQWLRLIKDDIQWLWRQLSNSSPLCDPEQDYSHWEFLMQSYPRYWKRLVSRGVQHESLQMEHAQVVHQRSGVIVRCLQEFGCLNPLVEPPCRDKLVSTDRGLFGCLQCEVACKTKAGEAVHQNRKHGVRSRLRFLYAGSSCPCCLKEYHLPERVHHHLRTSRRCRLELLARGPLPDPATGCGSKEHVAYEEAHNRLVPYQVGAGPLLPSPHADPADDAEENIEVDFALLGRINSCLSQCHDFPDDLLLAELRAAIRSEPVTWTAYCKTLDYMDALMEEVDQETDAPEMQAYLELRGRLRSTDLWPFMKTERITGSDLVPGAWESYLKEVLEAPGLTWRRSLSTTIPRSFGCERYLLHFFSGRRRAGDLQFYLDQFSSVDFVLHTVSIDIVVDSALGDLMSTTAQEYWIRAIRCGFVVGLLGGPPCETWSRARGRELEGRRGPRVLRTPEFPWGLCSLGLRELKQLIFGSTLLLYMLEAFIMVTLCGAPALLEHPAEPKDLSKVTIWRLVVVAIIEVLPGVSRYEISQGQFGSESSKPTALLCANLHNIRHHLRTHQLWKTPPTSVSIGTDSQGNFRTAKLKEYPPALNRALAGAFFEAVSNLPLDVERVVDSDFRERCGRLLCAEYGTSYGPDFAPH